MSTVNVAEVPSVADAALAVTILVETPANPHAYWVLASLPPPSDHRLTNTFIAQSHAPLEALFHAGLTGFQSYHGRTIFHIVGLNG